MQKRQLCMICLPLLLFLVFVGASGRGMPDAASRPWADGEKIRVQGVVYRQEDGEYGTKVYLKHISVLSKASQNIEAASGYEKKRILVYLKEKTTLKIGNQVQAMGLCAYPSAPENPGGFDAYAYYSAQDIVLFLKKAKIEKRDGSVEVLPQMLSQVRGRAAESLEAVFAAEDAGVIKAMLLGDRTELKGEIRGLYQDGGIIHILAISGVKTLNLASPRGAKKPENWAFLRLHRDEIYIIKRRFWRARTPVCPFGLVRG